MSLAGVVSPYESVFTCLSGRFGSGLPRLLCSQC